VGRGGIGWPANRDLMAVISQDGDFLLASEGLTDKSGPRAFCMVVGASRVSCGLASLPERSTA
jgi:hypothetical protein